jgi:hypothetical protein
MLPGVRSSLQQFAAVCSSSHHSPSHTQDTKLRGIVNGLLDGAAEEDHMGKSDFHYLILVG